LSKNNDIIVRYYQPGDEEKIVELLKKTFPKWTEFKDPLGLWKWKYINTPLARALLQYKDHIFLIGRGLQYPTALEAALKIKEVSYIHAEGFSGGELKHGTIALIEEGTPCIVFSSTATEKEIISNAMEIKARGGYIIGVNHKDNEVFDYFLKVPDVGDLNPVTQIIPIQILSYQLAVLRGADPDKPRNLAKSVTVK
jgi:glucosamine--fructose-6-phosphate aminotransferase (isomerizing)